MDDWADKPDPRKTKEYPAPAWVFDNTSDLHQPTGELEAIMVTAPGGTQPQVPADRGDTYKNLDSILGVELDLAQVEMDVLDALFVAGHSIREAAEVLGIPQTTVWRIKESALSMIRGKVDLDG